MRLLLGVLAGIILTALVPEVGDFTRDSLNDVFHNAQQAVEPKSTVQNLQEDVQQSLDRSMRDLKRELDNLQD